MKNTEATIRAQIDIEKKEIAKLNNLHNEGGYGYVDTSKLRRLAADLLEAKYSDAGSWSHSNTIAKRKAYNDALTMASKLDEVVDGKVSAYSIAERKSGVNLMELKAAVLQHNLV